LTPAQFLAQIKREEIAPAYLFLGAEGYQRARCRAALLDAMLQAEDREEGIARHDLGESSLAEVIDDARALSLFASRRVLLISNAEAALPRQKGDDDDGDGESAEDGATLLAAYLKDPSPGVVQATSQEKLAFDGKESQINHGRERGKKFTVKLSADGQTMTVNSIVHLGVPTPSNINVRKQLVVYVTEVWKLSNDGKSITVQANATSTSGGVERSWKTVFDKAN